MWTRRGVTLAAGMAAVAGVIALAAWGPLAPPAGPVSPTGHTLSEVYQAASGIGATGVGVPGTAVNAGGTLTLNFNAGALSAPVLTYSMKNATEWDLDLIDWVRGNLMVTAELTAAAAQLSATVRTGTTAPTAVLVVPVGAETMTMTLATAKVVSARYYTLPRGDGKVVHLVDLEVKYIGASSTTFGAVSWPFP